jgi:phosphoserine phosphatase
MASVLVLIAAQGSSAISSDVVRIVQNLGGALSWLSQGDAAEVSGLLQPEMLRKALHGYPLDINVVATAQRRKKILIADMDSTMIHQECIDELGVAAGVGDYIKGITARAMRGELNFEGALKERVALLKGLPATVIDEVIEKRITFMEGGKTLLSTMRAQGAYAALVSGGFTAFTSHVAHALGFDENRANELQLKDGQLTGEVLLPILGKEAKVESLKRICAMKGVSQQEVLAVGDGANDIPMLLEAAMGVALHAKPTVQAQARFVINHGDLTALLYLQGYHRSEFK